MTPVDAIAQAIRVSRLFGGVPAGQGAEVILAALEAEGIVLARRTHVTCECDGTRWGPHHDGAFCVSCPGRLVEVTE